MYIYIYVYRERERFIDLVVLVLLVFVVCLFLVLYVCFVRGWRGSTVGRGWEGREEPNGGGIKIGVAELGKQKCWCTEGFQGMRQRGSCTSRDFVAATWYLINLREIRNMLQAPLFMSTLTYKSAIVCLISSARRWT